MDTVEELKAEFLENLAMGFDNYVVNDLRLVRHLNQICAINRPVLEIPMKLNANCLYDRWDVENLR
jgi:hypothetical protein